MSRVCVFCGSSTGVRPAYAEAARAFGRGLVARGKGLVYGGGRVGLMGELARAVVEEGGTVTGVIPEALLAREVGYEELSDLRVVKSMHERKALMAELADAFVALPGGPGTFDEFFEIVTWAQLGMHEKPCALLNVEGYYDPLLAMLDRATEEGFLRAEQRLLVMARPDVDGLFEALASYRPVHVPKWIDKTET